MQRQREHHAIKSIASPSAARRVVRSHIRSPLVGLMRTVGVRRDEDVLVGILVGRWLYARPWPRAAPQGRFHESLILRGTITPWADGGTEVRLSIFRPRFELVWRSFLGIFAAVGVAGYVASGDWHLLLWLGWVGGLGLFGEAIRRAFRRYEPAERTLLARWMATVTTDLLDPGASGSHLA